MSGCTAAAGAAPLRTPPGGCCRARGARGHLGPSHPICVLFKGPFTFLLYTTIKSAFTLEPVPGVCWCVHPWGARGVAPVAAMASVRGEWHPPVPGPPWFPVTSWPQKEDGECPRQPMASQSHVLLCWVLPGWRFQKHDTWSLR